jgi:hypothetical protein
MRVRESSICAGGSWWYSKILGTSEKPAKTHPDPRLRLVACGFIRDPVFDHVDTGETAEAGHGRFAMIGFVALLITEYALARWTGERRAMASNTHTSTAPTTSARQWLTLRAPPPGRCRRRSGHGGGHRRRPSGSTRTG